MVRTFFLITFFLLSIFLKLRSEHAYIFGTVILLASLVMIFFERAGIALRLTTYAFGVFFIGSLIYLAEIKNEK